MNCNLKAFQDNLQEYDYKELENEDIGFQYNVDQNETTSNETNAQNNTPQDVKTIGILSKDYLDKSIYSEDEGLDDYKDGGYHPVFIGEILINRYIVI